VAELGFTRVWSVTWSLKLMVLAPVFLWATDDQTVTPLGGACPRIHCKS
jgi:hypothetical protein